MTGNFRGVQGRRPWSCFREGGARGGNPFRSKRKGFPSRIPDVSALENEIDCLVYSLYGLSEEDTAIVEGRG